MILYTNLRDEKYNAVAGFVPLHPAGYGYDDEGFDNLLNIRVPSARMFRYKDQRTGRWIWTEVNGGFPSEDHILYPSYVVPGAPNLLNSEYYIPNVNKINASMLAEGVYLHGSVDNALLALAKFLIRSIRSLRARGATAVGMYNWYPKANMSIYEALVLRHLDWYCPSIYSVKGDNAMPPMIQVSLAKPGDKHPAHIFNNPDKEVVPVFALEFDGEGGGLMNAASLGNTMLAIRDYYRATKAYLWGARITPQDCVNGAANLRMACATRGIRLETLS